jgi:hypothetical protein
VSLVFLPLPRVLAKLLAHLHALAVSHIINPSPLKDVQVYFNSQLALPMSFISPPLSSIRHLVLAVIVSAEPLFHALHKRSSVKVTILKMNQCGSFFVHRMHHRNLFVVTVHPFSEHDSFGKLKHKLSRKPVRISDLLCLLIINLWNHLTPFLILLVAVWPFIKQPLAQLFSRMFNLIGLVTTIL